MFVFFPMFYLFPSLFPNIVEGLQPPRGSISFKRFKVLRPSHLLETVDSIEATATNTTAGSGSRVAEASTSDYRVAVFGAGGVGKSSITQRFVKGTFNENYIPTIEDTYRQVISCNQKNVCTLQITDTTGSHQFPAMQRLSISKGNAFILIYSVTQKQTFGELAPIVEMMKEVKGNAISETPIMLVGNKKDEESKREVSTAAGQKIANQWGCGFIETSAKNNENITELFQQLLALEKKRQLALTMDDPDGKNGKKKGCHIM
uniref:GTP-binding protein Di-Ras2 n=1 Tax=Caenorhabditis tropicalis TaxID=1561998 RepID=A0A1I7TT11_9PELO